MDPCHSEYFCADRGYSLPCRCQNTSCLIIISSKKCIPPNWINVFLSLRTNFFWIITSHMCCLIEVSHCFYAYLEISISDMGVPAYESTKKNTRDIPSRRKDVKICISIRGSTILDSIFTYYRMLPNVLSDGQDLFQVGIARLQSKDKPLIAISVQNVYYLLNNI